MADTALTPSDRALLDRPLHGLLTIPPAPGRLPAPRPVWFEARDDGDMQLFSMAGAAKVRRLEADPRATLVVVEPPDGPEGWVSVEADVTVHRGGGEALAARLAERYWDDPDQPDHRAVLETFTEENLRRIVLHPRRSLGVRRTDARPGPPHQTTSTRFGPQNIGLSTSS